MERPRAVTWSGLGEWWRSEVESDPAYETVITPLLLEVLPLVAGERLLDLGCGEGRVMRRVREAGVEVHGVDVDEGLLSGQPTVIVAELPALPVRADCYDGVYCVLTLEHIEDHGQFFQEAARVTRQGGVMALVINHPVWTAPDATPISDQDGEVLWRPGGYFTDGVTEMPAGQGTVVFRHRSMSELLNAAAAARWSLERMVEQPHHELEDQAGIPRLLACRWRLR